ELASEVKGSTSPWKAPCKPPSTWSPTVASGELTRACHTPLAAPTVAATARLHTNKPNPAPCAAAWAKPCTSALPPIHTVATLGYTGATFMAKVATAALPLADWMSELYWSASALDQPGRDIISEALSYWSRAFFAEYRPYSSAPSTNRPAARKNSLPLGSV